MVPCETSMFMWDAAGDITQELLTRLTCYCRQICNCQSLKEPHTSIAFSGRLATGFISITYGQQVSISFTKHWNLVREQGGRRFKSSLPDQFSLFACSKIRSNGFLYVGQRFTPPVAQFKSTDFSN